MGQSAEEVRRDIEQTRAQMGDTIDEIGDRVSPRRMVERRTDRMRTSFRNARESVMGSAEYGASRVGDTASTAVDTLTSTPEMARRQTAGNPLAAGLIAFGGGVLVASLLPKTSTEQQFASKVAPALEPVVEQAKHAGQQVAEDLKGSAADAAEQLKDHASAAAEEVKEQASQATSHVTDEATAAAQQVKNPSVP